MFCLKAQLPWQTATSLPVAHKYSFDSKIFERLHSRQQTALTSKGALHSFLIGLWRSWLSYQFGFEPLQWALEVTDQLYNLCKKQGCNPEITKPKIHIRQAIPPKHYIYFFISSTFKSPGRAAASPWSILSRNPPRDSKWQDTLNYSPANR